MQLHQLNQANDKNYNGFLNDSQLVEKHDSISIDTMKTLQKINSFLLPILPAKAKAGTSYGHQYSILHQDIREWKHIKKGRVGNAIGIRVQGDSMEPEFSEGDILICKKIYAPSINQECVMVVVTKENNIFLKNVSINNDSSMIQMNSVNKEYPSFELDQDDILEFWKVDQKLKDFN